MFFLYENRAHWLLKFKVVNGLNVHYNYRETCEHCKGTKTFNLPVMTHEFVGITEEEPCCTQELRAFYMVPRIVEETGS